MDHILEVLQVDDGLDPAHGRQVVPNKTDNDNNRNYNND